MSGGSGTCNKVLLALAFVSLLIFLRGYTSDVFDVNEVTYLDSPAPGWQSPSAEFIQSQIHNIPNPSETGDGFYRIILTSRKKECVFRIWTRGFLDELYVNGVKVFTHVRDKQRMVHDPRRYDFNIDLPKAGPYLIAAKVSDTDGRGYFFVSEPVDQREKLMLLVFALSAAAYTVATKWGKEAKKFLKDDANFLFLIFGLCFLTYFISSAYVNNSNDGSHFALVSALVENQSVEIESFMSYTWGIDYAEKDGKKYSDRTPGTAFAAAPFYAFGKTLKATGVAGLVSSAKNYMEVTIHLLPSSMGAASVVLVILICMSLGFDRRVSATVGVTYGFATLSWFESTHLQSHILSQALVLFAAYLCLSKKRFDGVELVLFSAVMAFASIVEIQNILFIPAFAAYLVKKKKVSVKEVRKRPQWIAGAALVFFIIYSALLIYNYAAFSEFTIKSNKYNPSFPEEKSFATSLSGNPVLGLDKILFSLNNIESIWVWDKGVKNAIPGLFIVSPVYLLSMLCLGRFYKKYNAESLLFLSIIGFEFLVVAFHKTVLTRHVTTAYPFLFIPIAFYVKDMLREYGKGKYLKPVAFAVLAAVSASRVFYCINTYWGRNLEYPTPFLDELGTFILVLLPAGLIFYLVKNKNPKR